MKAIEHVKRIEKECNATCLTKDIKNNFKDILNVGEFANAEWDSNIDCLSEEYDCSNIKSLPSDEISKITYNLNQEDSHEWLLQNDWKSCGCESFFKETLIISLEKQDE